MKLYITICAFIACCAMTGCAPTKNVIPSLKYQKAIDVHIAKKAHIHWTAGRHISCEKPKASPARYSNNIGGGVCGIIAALMVDVAATAIKDQHRKNNPSQYRLSYDKADEVVFVTSLRDVLEKQQVFKGVELITDSNAVHAADDVLIKIQFKSARVTNFGSRIRISVHLHIKTANKRPYERTYFVQSYDSTKVEFLDRKKQISQELLTAVMNGIKQWHDGE